MTRKVPRSQENKKRDTSWRKYQCLTPTAHPQRQDSIEDQTTIRETCEPTFKKQNFMSIYGPGGAPGGAPDSGTAKPRIGPVNKPLNW